MTWTDKLISARKSVLNGLLRVRADDVLNPEPVDRTPVDPVQAAAEVRRAVNAFKAAAMDPDGRHVGYVQLRESKAFAEYRRVCTPPLRDLDLATLATREQRLAFWINLYNALVVDAVIAFGVQRSVTEGFAGVVRFFRRAAYNVGGYRFSCDDIEHGVLRANRGHPFIPGPQFGPSDPRRAFVVEPLDPRIHFALNCASRSCPPIGVYDAARIDAQLEVATRSFLDAEVHVDPERGEVCLSSILKWFGGDFGDVRAFVRRHLGDDPRSEWLRDRVARISYTPYNWALNT